jgi:hypothetical protein
MGYSPLGFVVGVLVWPPVAEVPLFGFGCAPFVEFVAWVGGFDDADGWQVVACDLELAGCDVNNGLVGQLAPGVLVVVVEPACCWGGLASCLGGDFPAYEDGSDGAEAPQVGGSVPWCRVGLVVPGVGFEGFPAGCGDFVEFPQGGCGLLLVLGFQAGACSFFHASHLVMLIE